MVAGVACASPNAIGMSVPTLNLYRRSVEVARWRRRRMRGSKRVGDVGANTQHLQQTCLRRRQRLHAPFVSCDCVSDMKNMQKQPREDVVYAGKPLRRCRCRRVVMRYIQERQRRARSVSFQASLVNGSHFMCVPPLCSMWSCAGPMSESPTGQWQQ